MKVIRGKLSWTKNIVSVERATQFVKQTTNKSCPPRLVTETEQSKKFENKTRHKSKVNG